MSALGEAPWVSAGEMGDYAYCPRAHWYARTRGDGTGEDDPRSAAGRSFHERSLSGVRERSARRGAYAAALLLALLLAAGAAWALARGL